MDDVTFTFPFDGTDRTVNMGEVSAEDTAEWKRQTGGNLLLLMGAITQAAEGGSVVDVLSAGDPLELVVMLVWLADRQAGTAREVREIRPLVTFAKLNEFAAAVEDDSPEA
jgi:hypothetical protein